MLANILCVAFLQSAFAHNNSIFSSLTYLFLLLILDFVSLPGRKLINLIDRLRKREVCSNKIKLLIYWSDEDEIDLENCRPPTSLRNDRSTDDDGASGPVFRRLLATAAADQHQ